MDPSKLASQKPSDLDLYLGGGGGGGGSKLDISFVSFRVQAEP